MNSGFRCGIKVQIPITKNKLLSSPCTTTIAIYLHVEIQAQTKQVLDRLNDTRWFWLNCYGSCPSFLVKFGANRILLNWLQDFKSWKLAVFIVLWNIMLLFKQSEILLLWYWSDKMTLNCHTLNCFHLIKSVHALIKDQSEPKRSQNKSCNQLIASAIVPAKYFKAVMR